MILREKVDFVSKMQQKGVEENGMLKRKQMIFSVFCTKNREKNNFF